MNIEFIEELPPKSRRDSGIYPSATNVAAALRGAEGRWAKIRTYAPDKKMGGYVFASQCRTGKNKALSPASGFEVETRVDKETKELHVYARFVGDFT